MVNLKSFFKQAFVFTLFLSWVIISACNSVKTHQKKEAKSADRPPNVIIVLADDQGYGDLGSHGHPILQTPNLDAFAKTAIEATNFHVGTTCTPTRAGLLTGRNANRNNAWHTIAGCSILNESEETIAQVFEKNNYRTGMFGKWHLGDNYPYQPQDRGFQEALYCKGGGVWQTPDYWKNDYFDDTYMRNGTPEKTTGYCTDVWFKEAMAYIEKNKDQPFFTYLALNAAHSPFNVPKEYLDLYEDADLPLALKRFNGMVTNLDHNFGQLLDFLKANDLDKNTIVIYTTDNGTAGGVRTNKETGIARGYNAGLKGQKGSHYDGGHRVPFFIRYPNGQLQGGKQTDELIAHVDILPTLANLCDLNFQPKKALDGTDRTQQLKKEATDTSRMLVIDTQRNQWPKKGRRATVVSKDWRLVNGSELYHTKMDPGQQNDVAQFHPKRVETMQTFYDEWWASTIPDWQYANIPIGHEKANPTLITVHDLHSEDFPAWNQVQIRTTKNNPKDGFYSVEVVSDGEYEFSLSRYPPESNLALNAEAAAIPYQDHLDGFPAGKVLHIQEGIVELGDLIFSTKTKEDALAIKIKAALPKGEHPLKTWFVLADGRKIPAYYSLVTKQL